MKDSIKTKKNSSFMKNLNIDTLLQNSLLVLTIIGFIFAIGYSLENITLSKNINVVLILPFIFFLTPYLILKLYDLKKVESKMQVVPRFLRDVVDNVESGMDLVTSIKNTIGNEYVVLNDDIRKLTNQLSWGISFEKALINFAKNIGSKDLLRDFRLIVEARSVGGHVEKLLREVSEKINTENLRVKQRRSNLASNTFTGYISFIIFIFIIIITYNNLFLQLGEVQAGNQGGDLDEASNAQLAIYLTLLTLLSYELAILSGFLFGLMSENNIISGAPHVVALMFITFLGFFFFIG